MGEQLTFQTIGGATVTVRKRGKHYIQPRGYVCHPGGGPQGETCGTCKHICRRGGVAGRYLKCALNEARWTGGKASDVLASAPACEKWESAT